MFGWEKINTAKWSSQYTAVPCAWLPLPVTALNEFKLIHCFGKQLSSPISGCNYSFMSTHLVPIIM